MDEYNFEYNASKWEKLAIWIKPDGERLQECAIAIANCPDDYSICSMIFKKGNHSVRHMLNEEQVDEMIKALQKVKMEM